MTHGIEDGRQRQQPPPSVAYSAPVVDPSEYDAYYGDEYDLPLRYCTFREAIVRQNQLFFRGKGRASQSEYWWPLAAAAAAGVLALVFMLLVYAFSLAEATWGEIAGLVCFLFAALAGIAVLVLLMGHIATTIRRLHDANLSGWWLLALWVAGMITGLGILGVIAIGCLPPNVAGRRFDRPSAYGRDDFV